MLMMCDGKEEEEQGRKEKKEGSDVGKEAVRKRWRNFTHVNYLQ